MNKVSQKPQLTAVSTLHYIRLVYRSLLFLAFLVLYLTLRIRGKADIAVVLERRPVILSVIWTVFTAEMILRFFPSRYESPGCQKQFRDESSVERL